MLKKVIHFIESNRMLQCGDHVILGISGGADSMCLLYVMHRLEERYRLSLTAVHVNHGLRGGDADADEAFVEQACQDLGVECVHFHANIRAMAAERKFSEEEAGRVYRYECFERVRAKKNARRIAVAHHLGDQAETVLFNLFRGSALSGLGGIAPVRGALIRPLLCLERGEIEDFLRAEGVTWRTDQSNFDTAYTRNRIRLDLLPYVTEHINAGAIAHIAEAARAVREAYTFIREQAEKALVHIADAAGNLDTARLLSLDPVLQREIIRLWLERDTGKLRDVTAGHIESVRSLMQKPDGKCIHLPHRVTVVRRDGQLCLEKRREDCGFRDPAGADASIGSRAENETIAVRTGQTILLPDSGPQISFELRERKENESFPQNICTKWFDYDKIKSGLNLRHRLAGDFMAIAPEGRKKLLRRVMIDDKMPASVRDGVWLLADGPHILWVLPEDLRDAGRASERAETAPQTPDGLRDAGRASERAETAPRTAEGLREAGRAHEGRISEYYKITEATKRVLVVTVRQRADH